MCETMSEKDLRYLCGNTVQLSGTEAYPEIDIYGRVGTLTNKVLRLEREMTYMQREMADIRRKLEEMSDNESKPDWSTLKFCKPPLV